MRKGILRHTTQREHSPFSRSQSKGLQARIAFSYAWITTVVVLVIMCLYAGFLVGHLRFAASQHMDMAEVMDYPWMAALIFTILILVLAPLLGGFFGTLTTKSMVGRVEHLVTAIVQVSNGNYEQRVPLSGKDEIGQLEHQFNQMAQQLAESIKAREELAQQHARLTERARISRELHDTLSQNLFSIRMLVDGLRIALPGESVFQSQLAILEQTTVEMTQEMRALLLEMRPLLLEEQGLATALEDLAERYRSRVGIPIVTDLSPVLLGLQDEQALFRVAQEALSNAVRHAHATSIALSLSCGAETTILTITDNGKGFSQDQKDVQQGVGLPSMQERILERRGVFEIKTVLGQGTSIIIYLRQKG